MVVLITCKNQEDLIKDEGARVVTTYKIEFSDAQGQLIICSRAANSVVSGGTWPKFKLIKAFMHVLITVTYRCI